MSGSELMDEIEYYTDWRPSPGSIYPLLSKLDELGLIEFVESEDPFLKRYALTSTGLGAIEEHRKVDSHIRSRYYSIQKMYWKLFRGMDEGLFEAYFGLLMALENIHLLLERNPEAVPMVQDLLRGTAKKVEEISGQLVKPQ